MTFKPATQRAVNEVFCFFADQKDNELKPKYVLPAIRALGLPLTIEQLQEINDDQKISYDMETFERTIVEIVERRKPENLNKEIRNAFEALKNDNGSINKSYLKNLLQSSGEKLTKDEVMFSLYL